MHLSPCFLDANADTSQPKPSTETDAAARMRVKDTHSREAGSEMSIVAYDSVDLRIYVPCRCAMESWSQKRARLRADGCHRENIGFCAMLKCSGVEIAQDDYCIFLRRSTPSTYGHSQLKTGHPVRSAIHKQLNGRLVLRWVTTWESLLLYVLSFFCYSTVYCSWS
jgi:hypothetical protein